MRISAPIYKLKRQAKMMARETGIALHAALDRIAADHGFASWSHIAAAHRPGPAKQMLEVLEPGDLVLVAARPGHGKTLLGLELARQARKLGRVGMFFSLEYTHRDVTDRLDAPVPEDETIIIDTSDDICADTIITRLRRQTKPVLTVVDYLQVLDQRRETPVVSGQLAALKAHACATGAIIVVLSQIDRRFDPTQDSLPGLRDIRMPNPFDPGIFDKACFLQDGEVQVGPVVQGGNSTPSRNAASPV